MNVPIPDAVPGHGILQFIGLAAVMAFPDIAMWLPNKLLD